MIERMNDLIKNIAADHADRSICKPPERWTDGDTGDEFEAAVTKDGEWLVVTRTSTVRGEVVRMEIPREVLRGCIQHLGGTL